MINHVKGNLIDLAEQGVFDHIVHGCNCFHVMGAGIAREIRIRYPQAAQVDKDLSNRGDFGKLGKWTESAERTNLERRYWFSIINAYTQYGYAVMKLDPKRCGFEYEAFDRFLSNYGLYVFGIVSTRYYFEKIRIGFPMIGAGLGGGDWGVILRMLERFEKSVEKCATVTIVEYQPGEKK